MKKLFFMMTLISLIAGFAVGCGSKSSNDNSSPYYDPRIDGRRGNTPISQNGVVLTGRIEITDGKVYRQYLEDIGACLSFWDTTCKWVDNAPQMTIEVFDYKFSRANTSGGAVILYTQAGVVDYGVDWQMHPGGTGFDSQPLNYGAGYNKYFKIKVTGRSTDSTVLVELKYGEKRFGYGYLERVNR